MFSPNEQLYTTPDLNTIAAHELRKQLILERILRKSGCLGPKPFYRRTIPPRLPDLQIKSYHRHHPAVEEECPLKTHIDNEIREKAVHLGLKGLLDYNRADLVPLPLLTICGAKPSVVGFAVLNTNQKGGNTADVKPHKKKRKHSHYHQPGENEVQRRLRAMREREFHSWEADPDEYLESSFQIQTVKQKPERLPWSFPSKDNCDKTKMLDRRKPCAGIRLDPLVQTKYSKPAGISPPPERHQVDVSYRDILMAPIEKLNYRHRLNPIQEPKPVITKCIRGKQHKEKKKSKRNKETAASLKPWNC